MSRPLWRFAHYWTEFFFEGSRYAGRQDHLRGATYYHSKAGAEFAARLDYEHGGGSDYDRFAQVEKLQPGRVYDHQRNAWVDGMTYQPERFAPPPVLAECDDEIPF